MPKGRPIYLSPVSPQEVKKSPEEIMEAELAELTPCVCSVPVVTIGGNQPLRQGYKLCGRCWKIIVQPWNVKET